jgi:DNA-binding NarL/FixJ family response regulator
VAAVRHLSAGRRVGLAEDQGSPDRDEEPIEHLTPRESSLLLLLERGLRFKQIALQMDISESTAKGYARNVFAKLGVHSRSEAVYEARRQGVLELLTGGARTAPVQPPDPGA